MAKKPVIMLKGGALFMDCIAARLQKDTGLEVRRDGEVKPALQAKDPDPPAVVLFDFDQIGLGALYAYLTDQPGPLVLGLSLAQNKVVLIFGEPRTVATVDELQELIAVELNSGR